ncbi:hypothetical protein BKA81DRAFT_4538 [Phyllosticta paracitricarpa]|uniref:Transmembrane protein n=2 Tax=Phyllosticta TaxID=121621 RepID=A0ABR1MK20_9PEZI
MPKEKDSGLGAIHSIRRQKRDGARCRCVNTRAEQSRAGQCRRYPMSLLSLLAFHLFPSFFPFFFLLIASPSISSALFPFLSLSFPFPFLHHAMLRHGGSSRVRSSRVRSS